MCSACSGSIALLGDAIIKDIYIDNTKRILTLHLEISRRDRCMLVYEEVLFSQLDERHKNIHILLVEEILSQKKKMKMDLPERYIYSGARIFVHHEQNRKEYVVIARKVQVPEKIIM